MCLKIAGVLWRNLSMKISAHSLGTNDTHQYFTGCKFDAYDQATTNAINLQKYKFFVSALIHGRSAIISATVKSFFGEQYSREIEVAP